MEYLPQCDLVVSATASPNFTLKEEDFAQLHCEQPLVLLDLAVPRDIDPALSDVEGITLYDMDSFRSGGVSPEQEKKHRKSRQIVQIRWRSFTSGWREEM